MSEARPALVRNGAEKPSTLALVADEDERQKRQPDRLGIDACRVALDDAALLQFPDALEHGRGRQIDLSGNLGIRRSGVFLENRQYSCVNCVDHSAILNQLRRFH